VHLALHVARLAGPAVAQEPRELADRLSRTLIGDAVDHDDGDAIGRAHSRRTLALRPERVNAEARQDRRLARPGTERRVAASRAR